MIACVSIRDIEILYENHASYNFDFACFRPLEVTQFKYFQSHHCRGQRLTYLFDMTILFTAPTQTRIKVNVAKV